MTLIVAFLTILSILPVSLVSEKNAVGYIAIFFSATLIYTLPRFSHSTRNDKSRKNNDLMFFILSSTLVVLFLFSITIYYIPKLDGIILWIMGGAIIYSMAIMVYPTIISKEHHKLDRSAKYLGLFTLIVFPILFIIDFCPYVFSMTSTNNHILIFPGFYLILQLGLILSIKKRPKGNSFNIDTFCSAYNITPRESEVLLLLYRGESYKTIADNLCISLSTVKTHVTKLYQKSNTKNKIEIITLLREST